MSNSAELMENYVNGKDTWWNRPLWGYIPEEQPWWNRPLWGKANLIDAILNEFNKPKIPEGVILNYKKYLHKLSEIELQIVAINSQRFNQKEFLLYLDIKYKLEHNLEAYQGLFSIVDLLLLGIETKNLFINLEHLELRYRTSKQQEFYQFISFLLPKNLNKEQFLNLINEKVEDILPSLITEYSKTALKSYLAVLESLSNYHSGLKLLYLFKKYQLTNYSILRSLSQVVDSLLDKDISDFKVLLTVVKVNEKLFSKLTEIVGLDDEKAIPETYALILQYMALSYKYKMVYTDFQKITEVFQIWLKYYQAILAIRQEYNAHYYKQPQEFKQDIPGEIIFNKYKLYL